MMLASSCANSGGKPEDPTGLWGQQEQGQPWLELSNEGKVAGSDGCNNLMSTWSQEAEKISFSAMASTMMYCRGVDTWLSTADHATIQDGSLLVFDANDQQIGTLPRGAR
ncbi:META domain-containing protein [Arthrobacter sp. JCM 19049]|uniref:META domain-containing protein n=1 Tax=Arthrobacter sp. JCM 19049 TaxID=1460643 RepID=UPI0024363F2A|nr:META domain-containing protein [Arthrobacter sp. JCM 19049]